MSEIEWVGGPRLPLLSTEMTGPPGQRRRAWRIDSTTSGKRFVTTATDTPCPRVTWRTTAEAKAYAEGLVAAHHPYPPGVNGSLERALEMVTAAKLAGHAATLQVKVTWSGEVS